MKHWCYHSRMQSSIAPFIAHARSKGMDHQTIRMLLLSAGWKEKDISSALVSESLAMPVPLPPDTGSARDAFFHLLTFTTLYALVISSIILAFQFIERTFADPAFRSVYFETANTSAIRWSLAVILVSYPLFAFLARTLHRECVRHPEKLQSGVRRWLTYLTLFVTACTISGDLITLLFYLLQGELTIRFLLKVFAVLSLSGLPFMYYFAVIRFDPQSYVDSRIHRVFFWIISVIVFVAVVWGIATAGSPLYGRKERLDETRVNDLRLIREEIMDYVYGPERFNGQKITVLPKPLPPNLDVVAKNATYAKLSIFDPDTQNPYEYVIRGSTFDLCATFSLSQNLDYNITWNHPAGSYCFTFDAFDRQNK